ncbi:aminopeptidase P family protein [Ruminococcus sp. NK3A76]|uniref:M24 family metallopeptidase n=1 Tax=Ruminococcus sp. NK3A76 TaxID=877411 RepID=UPI00048DDC96|nr:aminopeptidase P family protein [Ruminococcus sp. NK3A76]
MSRLDRLSKLIKTDCALITSDINRRYFTGMKSSAGTVLLFKDKAYLIIDFRYIEKAKNLLAGDPFIEVVLQDKLYEQINSLIAKHGAETIAVESMTVTVSQLESYKNKLSAEVVSSDDLSDSINTIRMIKTPDETEKMIQAQRIAETGFEHMLEFIHEGVTERELQLELDYFMLKNGAEALSFDTIALSGKNTSLPHGVPGDKKIEKGDFVLLDFGSVVDGYHSDMTRTVCVGEPSEKMKRVYDIVLKAQLAALDAVKAGITGRELDKIARDIISAEGFGEQFGHSLGHGVGVEIHEPPYAAKSYDKPLPENSIVTVEPGIYIENEFGVRIEDFVIVKNDGCVNMTKAPKQLIIL